MIATSDPVAWVALALLVAVGVLTWRLRSSRHTRRAYARRLAQATGHPLSGMARGTAWADRRALADAAAHHLAGLGLVAERRTHAPIVWARGQAGSYVLTVTSSRILVEYETGVDELELVELGEFVDVDSAIREIATHADLRTPA